MPKQVDKRADHVEIPLSLELEGDFNRIGKFVNHLEMSPLPIAIKSLDMRPSSRQLKLLDVKLDLTASLPAARKMP
jgi:Tfp pilus assembly protein PilO